MTRLTLVVLASLASSSVLAGGIPPTPVSEPGILGLFGQRCIVAFVRVLVIFFKVHPVVDDLLGALVRTAMFRHVVRRSKSGSIRLGSPVDPFPSAVLTFDVLVTAIFLQLIGSMFGLDLSCCRETDAPSLRAAFSARDRRHRQHRG